MKSRPDRYLAIMFIAVSIILFPTVSAFGTDFTLTADFDSGFKTPLAGGNLGIETITDNLAVPDDSFSLGTPQGDSFTSTDSDADTEKWNLESKALGTINQREIATGVFSVDVSGGVAQSFAGVISNNTLTGNFDVRVKVDDGPNSAILPFLYFQATNNAAGIECGDDVLQDGLLYFINFIAVGSPMSAFKCVNGVLTQIGTNTNRPSDPIWLRFTSSGTTFTFFYSTDGNSWTQDEQFTDAAISGSFYSELLCSANDPARCDLDFDDYHVFSGTFSSGFRITGQWRSANQQSTTENFININVIYSNVSVVQYITAVSLIDGSGQYVFVDNSDVTTDTSMMYNVPVLQILGAWSVQINLTGDGSGTPNISAVQIFTSLDVSSPVILILVTFLLTFAFTFILGAKKHPLFYILCGIIGISGAIVVWRIISPSDSGSATILTTSIIGVSSLIILMGFTAKIEWKGD